MMVLANKCKYRELLAQEKALGFTRFCPKIYELNAEEWRLMLGVEVGDAYGIYNLICSFALESVGFSELQLRNAERERE